MADDARRGAVILAGGHSTRFGSEDKATAVLAGSPMIRRVADRLHNIIDELVINCRAEQRQGIGGALNGYPLEVTYAIDEIPNRGPMAGIHTGLSALEYSRLSFVVACDMPFVDPPVVSHLFNHLGEADAAVPRVEGKWLETTHAVYRRDTMIDACQAALDADESRIVHALDRLDVQIVDVEDLPGPNPKSSFHNINTPVELEQAAEQVRRESQENA